MSFKVVAFQEYMENVDSEEIDAIQEKIFYVYNNLRQLKDGEKLKKVKEYAKRLNKRLRWSVVILKSRAASISYDKFFMFKVSCKYIIGIAGIGCH